MSTLLYHFDLLYSIEYEYHIILSEDELKPNAANKIFAVSNDSKIKKAYEQVESYELIGLHFFETKIDDKIV